MHAQGKEKMQLLLAVMLVALPAPPSSTQGCLALAHPDVLFTVLPMLALPVSVSFRRQAASDIIRQAISRYYVQPINRGHQLYRICKTAAVLQHPEQGSLQPASWQTPSCHRFARQCLSEPANGQACTAAVLKTAEPTFGPH